MGKIKFMLYLILFCIGFSGCSSDAKQEELTEMYMPIFAYLEKREFKEGETMNLYVYPPNQGQLPQQYQYIESVEYFIDGKSVGKSYISPFSITYTPNLPIGVHIISVKLYLNVTNVIWETKETSFKIIEKK